MKSKLLSNRNIVFFTLYFCLAKMLFDSQLQMVVINEVKGISTLNIGLLEILLLLSTLILEIPSGFIADGLGYRNTLIISRVFILAYSLFMLVSQNVVQIAFGFVCYGISEAMTSGTEETFIFQFSSDTNILTRLNSLLQILSTVGGMIAVLIGGYLMGVDWSLIYYFSIAVQVGSLIMLLMINDDRKHRENNRFTGLLADFRRILKSTRDLYKTRQFLLLSIGTMICDTVYSTFLIFYSILLRQHDFSYISISFLSVFGVVLGFGFILVYGRLERRIKNIPLTMTFWLRVILAAVSLVAAVSGRTGVVYGSALIIVAFVNVYFPSALTLLNQYVSDDIRATANSITNAMQTFLMCLLIPLYTRCLDSPNYTFYAYIIPATMFLVSALVILPVFRKTSP